MRAERLQIYVLKGAGRSARPPSPSDTQSAGRLAGAPQPRAPRSSSSAPRTRSRRRRPLRCVVRSRPLTQRGTPLAPRVRHAGRAGPHRGRSGGQVGAPRVPWRSAPRRRRHPTAGRTGPGCAPQPQRGTHVVAAGRSDRPTASRHRGRHVSRAEPVPTVSRRGVADGRRCPPRNCSPALRRDSLVRAGSSSGLPGLNVVVVAVRPGRPRRVAVREVGALVEVAVRSARRPGSNSICGQRAWRNECEFGPRRGSEPGRGPTSPGRLCARPALDPSRLLLGRRLRPRPTRSLRCPGRWNRVSLKRRHSVGTADSSLAIRPQRMSESTSRYTRSVTIFGAPLVSRTTAAPRSRRRLVEADGEDASGHDPPTPLSPKTVSTRQTAPG